MPSIYNLPTKVSLAKISTLQNNQRDHSLYLPSDLNRSAGRKPDEVKEPLGFPLPKSPEEVALAEAPTGGTEGGPGMRLPLRLI